MSLRSKLFGAVAITLGVVLLFLVGFTLIRARERQQRTEMFHEAMVHFATELGAQTDPEFFGDSPLFRAEQLDPAMDSLAVFRVPADGGAPELQRARGAPLTESEGHAAARGLVSRLGADQEWLQQGNDVAVALRRSDRSEPEAARVVLYMRFLPIGVDPVDVSRATFLTVLGSAVVLLLMMWLIVDRVVARPLREVAAGAERVAEGDYSQPVPGAGSDDEIQKVVTAFNQMMVELGALQGQLHERIQEALNRAQRTQDSLVIAQRLAATGQLAAGIAHEVNNPLGGMLNAVHSLSTKEMTPAKREEYFELVEEGLRRIQATVAKILQFTPHNVAPRPVDLADVVRPMAGLVRHRVDRLGVELVLDVQEGVQVFGDPYELQQALLNVVLNALDAVEEADEDEMRVTVQSGVNPDAPGEARLLVRDNGPGMAPEAMPRAFDLFFTTKEAGKGSGLGLATAHKIVSDHGGRVELRAADGGGLEVEFILPHLDQG